MKKKKIDNMTPQELDDYCKQLPEHRPPKWSAVLCAIGLAAMLSFHFATTVSAGTPKWGSLGVAVFLAAAALFLIYRIFTFNNTK